MFYRGIKVLSLLLVSHFWYNLSKKYRNLKFQSHLPTGGARKVNNEVNNGRIPIRNSCSEKKKAWKLGYAGLSLLSNRWIAVSKSDVVKGCFCEVVRNWKKAWKPGPTGSVLSVLSVDQSCYETREILDTAESVMLLNLVIVQKAWKPSLARSLWKQPVCCTTQGVSHSIEDEIATLLLSHRSDIPVPSWPVEINNYAYSYSCLQELKLLRSGDVEENPGPEERGQLENDQPRDRSHDLRVTSYNVRGLNDDAKLRHLINYCYGQNLGKNKDSVYCFQETYVQNAGKIPYLWRGNFHLTPGRGNSLGCLTLLSSHLNVVSSRDLDGRGHVLAVQKLGEMSVTYVICNLYAPNSNNQEKIDFYEDVFDNLLEFEQLYDCNNVIVVRDFNLVFKMAECKNRSFGRAEQNVAKAVKRIINSANLDDLWATNPRFTWRRPNSESFSSIDRILFNKGQIAVNSINVNWSLSFSDHAAIEVGFKIVHKETRLRSKIARLDPSLMKEPGCKQRIIDEVNEMYGRHMPTWNPHLKLEYAKVCIRTVSEKVQADRKKQEKSEEDLLNYEMEIAMMALERGTAGSNEGLIDYIEELRGKKAILVDKKGKRLAERLGTKWYNEGEKSTRYFLRLLNRATPDDFVELEKDTGEVVRGEESIEEEIVKYYKALYEDFEVVANENENNFFEHISECDRNKGNDVTKPFTEAELLGVLGTCRDSAPGPDGIPYSYITGLWHIMGPLMIDAWNYSLRTGNLSTSHKLSFLKLIPKAGKDLKKLTNWRPITLSNCDHKLITKTYAKRLSMAVESCIDERQTAYLKGRQIGDNIRALLASVQSANLEDNIDGLIVSLDAKKAFDSVSHEYIERCLIKFGLNNFVPVFRILYKDLKSDVIINGRVTNGYLIKRGVKQGDALSCILFIMCMEPLLRNIENNIEIQSIRSTKIESTFPKAYAYADDVSVVTRNSLGCVQEIFLEYERLTRLSGLELNASKTELLRFKSGMAREAANFNVDYLNKRHRLETAERVKINGIYLQQNHAQMKESNLDSVRRRIEENCAKWSRRRLCLLGKILILKCFGISQVIYLMQCMSLTDKEIKSINGILYKFLWNRHFDAAKAPERISREIINTPIKLGGFGMLNISELDKSLKLRSLGRLLVSCHPMLSIIRNQINLDEFFYPSIGTKLDMVAYEGVQLLMEDRRKLWSLDTSLLGVKGVSLIRDIRLRSMVSANGRNSMGYFNLRRLGKIRVADLNSAELESINRFVDRSLLDCCRYAVNINVNIDVLPMAQSTILRNKIVELTPLSSKTIRVGRTPSDPICIFKSGIINTPSETINWASKLSKLTSTRLKSILLRVAHREYYTKERLHRYRLIDSPSCPRCDQIESYDHKVFSCSYVEKIWIETFKLTDKEGAPTNLEALQARVLGTRVGTDLIFLTVHSEILNRIFQLKDEANYLMRPSVFARRAIEHLAKRENNLSKKHELLHLLIP